MVCRREYGHQHKKQVDGKKGKGIKRAAGESSRNTIGFAAENATIMVCQDGKLRQRAELTGEEDLLLRLVLRCSYTLLHVDFKAIYP